MLLLFFKSVVPMNRYRLLSLILLSFAAAVGSAEIRSAKIVWRQAPAYGLIQVSNGSLHSLRVALGRGKTSGNTFSSKGQAPLGLLLTASSDDYPATLISLQTNRDSCSFFLGDVHREHPIYLPSFGLAVTEAQDPRDYTAIESSIRNHGWLTKLAQISQEPEESFANAAGQTREMSCQTWLGLSRDMRTFAISERMDWVQPRLAGTEVRLPETNDRGVRYHFLMGRGWGVQDRITRRLEEGCLPILHGTLIDESIRYELTAFVSLEKSRLLPHTLRGTHFLVADGYSAGHTFTAAFSQPYYSQHPRVHLQRGEVAAFLKAYYNTVAALADRQTYTFWEHLYGVSPHKTHEEGWFLMQTRWMLYMEEGTTLNLLPGIPRSYLEQGKQIRLKNVASYFGPLSLNLTSQLAENKILAEVECNSERKPARVRIRLPHPDRQSATSMQGGVYDPLTESVCVEPFNGRAQIVLSFAKKSDIH